MTHVKAQNGASDWHVSSAEVRQYKQANIAWAAYTLNDRIEEDMAKQEAAREQAAIERPYLR